MTARELDILERAFAAEVNGALAHSELGGLYQSRSRVAEHLATDGYLDACVVELGGRFPVTVHGYRLTHLGRLAYCSSPRCQEESE